MKKIIILAVSAFVLSLTGCQNSGSSEPKAVLNNFFEAIGNRNINEAKKYVTKDSEGMMGMMEMGMNNMPDSSGATMFNKENLDFGDAVINGERATVKVKDKRTGEVTDFVLKKESGDWKVAFDKSTLMEMAQKKMKEHGMNGMEGMDNGNPGNMNMDSLQNRLNNLTPEEKARAQKMMDSASKMLEEMQKNAR